MSTNDYIEGFIRSCEMIANEKMSTDNKKIVGSMFSVKRILKKEHFIIAGEVPEYLAFNLNGILRCYYNDIEGNEITKYFCFEKTFFSSYSAMISQRETKLYIQAIEDCDLVVAKYELIKKIFDGDMFWIKLIKNYQEKLLLYKEEREESFLMCQATERYVQFIEKNREAVEKINNEYIASYIGITPESLSRIRRNLKKSINK